MASFSIITFGCQMNQHDSQRLSEVLSGAGFAWASQPEQADVIVLNTCSVRDKAEQKLRSEVGRWAVVKRTRPDLVLVVAGCVAQQEGARLLRRAPGIDLVVGPDNLAELPALLREIELGAPPRAVTEFDAEAPRFLRAQAGSLRCPCAFVTVMKGCNERCSFCIVPYTRGPERYRPAAEIVDEIARLVDAGVKEVTLLGQTVNSYRDPAGSLPAAPGAGELDWEHTRQRHAAADESEFAALLRRIAVEVPTLARLRYTSPHPRHLTRSLIRAHAELGVLARHVHMPLQSGSDAVLKRMIRRYSAAEFLERCNALREVAPGLTLTTDVIVGFPGETDDDFERTLSVVAQLGCTGLFGFKYSPRPYTPSLKLADDVSEEEKSRRLAALFELAERLRSQHLSGLVGSEQRVLVDSVGDDDRCEGRTERNEIVHFSARPEALGELIRVEISRAYNNSLEGEVPARWSPPPRPASCSEGRHASPRRLPVTS